jgi:hypothetical protein
MNPLDPIAGRRLLELLNRKRSDGRPVFPSRHVKDLFCLLVLSSGVRTELLPPNLQRMLGEFALRVGFSGKGSLSNAVSAYFISHPLDPELLKEFRGWMKQDLGIHVPMPASARVASIKG